MIKVMRLSDRRSFALAGFTLAEMTVYAMVFGVVSIVALSFMRSGTILATKNAGVVRSHESLRGALDRLASNLQSASNVPTLINTSGATTTAPAAGIRYDRFLGEPYVLDPPLSAGSVSASASMVRVHRSTHALASPPIPQANDVLLINGPNGTIRARITSVTTEAASGGTQRITCNLSAAIGAAISWSANQPQVVRLVRPEAFIVMSANGKNELRFFPSFEPMPSLTSAASFRLLTDQIGTQTGEGTPFSILDVNGDRLVQAALRARAQDVHNALAKKQKNAFNTYFQLNIALPSRHRTKVSN